MPSRLYDCCRDPYKYIMSAARRTKKISSLRCLSNSKKPRPRVYSNPSNTLLDGSASLPGMFSIDHVWTWSNLNPDHKFPVYWIDYLCWLALIKRVHRSLEESTGDQETISVSPWRYRGPHIIGSKNVQLIDKGKEKAKGIFSLRCSVKY